MNVSGVSTAGAGVTITLTAPRNPLARHHIYSVDVRLNNESGSAVAGSAALAVTSTNLNNWPHIRLSNALAAWTDRGVIEENFGEAPLLAQAPGIASTIVLPTPGAGCVWTFDVNYDEVI